MKTLSEDLIRRFLKESSINNSAFIDDAPPTFYKSFGEYRDESKKWLDSLYAELGWQVVDYMISDGAEDPGFDYKLRYRALGSPTFGDAGTKRGAKESVTLWKKRKQKELSQLGWEVVAWLGEKEAYKSVIGTILAPGANQKREVSEHNVQMFSKEWWLESLKEVSKTGTPKGSEEIGGYKGFVDEKDYESYKKWISKSLRVQLLEGGAAGHMNHPFDDADLTFGDLKKIIKLGLSGKLNREDNVTEKLDGQNLLISWKGNQLVAARNKGQLKGFGENALNINAVKSLFAGRGVIKDTFVFAMKDLSKAITKLSDKQKEKVFGNGKRWMNLEVMYPASANVVNYDGAYLVFHNATEYTEAGVAKKIDASLARILEGMIRQVNQHVQKKFTISKPNFLKVAKTQDFAKRQKYFLSKLQKLQNIYRLKDNDTLGKYHETYWMEFIYNASKQYKYRIPRTVLLKLTKRWAFLDKSFRLDKKNIKNEKFLDWAKSTDKKDLKKLQKDNIKPFEILFFELGAEILKNVSGFLAANPKATVAKMKKEVDAAVKQLKSAKDVSKLDTLKRQLEKFEAIGGSDAIVPSEGIVFKYKNKIYKFTGAFAPINQILGLLKFG